MGHCIVIVGATSAIAHSCARIWALDKPDEFVLIARDQNKLDRVVADLRVRSPETTITSIVTNFLDPVQIADVVSNICQTRDIDIVLIAHGDLPLQGQCQSNLTLLERALKINAISPVLFAEAFVENMSLNKPATLAIISSVAGDRGRRTNYIYGSAKALVSSYGEGLQHRLFNTNLKVVIIKPGPTDSPMTAALKEKGAKLSPVDLVSRGIVAAIKRNVPVAYVPKIWFLIMLIIRHLPRTIFNRLNI